MPRIAILYNEPVLPADHPDYASEAGVLESVEAFTAALGKADYEVLRLGIGRSLVELVQRLERQRPDVVVNFCEGFGGRSSGEANVTGMLELLGVPYTGSTPECLALVRDKVRTKQVLVAAGVPTAAHWLVRRDDDSASLQTAGALRQALHDGRLFVKPAAEDASLGIDERSVAETWEALARKVAELQSAYGDVLVERYLDGREFNLGVIALPEPQPLPIAEIEFQTTSELPWPIVTYQGKWSEHSAPFHATPVRCPAEIDRTTAERLNAIALAAFRATGCRDYARVDFRVTPNGGVYVLEVNANPDLAPSAGFAGAMAAAGISYGDFALRLIETAVGRPRHSTRPGGPTGSSPDRQVGDFGRRVLKDVRRTGTPGIHVRPFKARDKGALLEVLAACQMFRPDEIQVAAEVLDEALPDGVSGHYRVLVAEADGQPVGWSCHGRVPLTDATYDLYWIAVHPQYQGSGVGRAMLDEVQRLLERAGGRWLLAETSSAAAYAKTRDFYERAGFDVVGDVPDFYRAGDGRITYAKRLAEQ